MSDSTDINELFDQINNATDEIAKLKSSIRFNRAANPEGDAIALESALNYWEQNKQEAEEKLRRISNI